jgi:hypothetical protein
VAPRVSRSLQLYTSNRIQQVLEKLAVAALLRFHAVNKTQQFIKNVDSIRYRFLSRARYIQSATCPYPEPDTYSPLLVPIQSQIHTVRYLSLSRARYIQSATCPYPEPDTYSPLLVPIQSQIHRIHYWSVSRARYIQSATGCYP